MQMKNCTGDEAITRALNQEYASSKAIPVFLSTVNIFLSITASLGNVLILIALHKVTSVHPPTKLWFRCLAVADLCVGLISQPLFAIRMLNGVVKLNLNALYYLVKVEEASSFIFCEVFAFTSTAISVDRLLALLLGVRYRHVVTLRRVRAVITCFWLISSLAVFKYLMFESYRITLTAAITFAILSVIISVFSYTKILLKLRQHQIQVQEIVQPNGGRIPLNIARYKKTVLSIAWVQLVLVVCYVPSMTAVAIIEINGYSCAGARIAWSWASTLVFLNSSLNPFLYCWKIGEVKHQVKRTVRQLYCL